MRTFNIVLVFVTFLVFQAKAEFLNISENPDSIIIAAIERIDQDSMYSNVESLQNMGTRFMLAPNRKQVATWIMNKFLSYGFTEVQLDSFASNTNFLHDTTTWQYNVEARITGTEFPDQEMIMIGHYDDYAGDADPFFQAPGADDNASGTAATLECARVIKVMNYQPRQTMIFLASAAEELMGFGLSGTEYYANQAELAGRNIVMALNNDMIGWDDGTWTIQVINNNGSADLTALAISVIANYTTLNYESVNPGQFIGGDIQPFLDAGYKGVYFMEHFINPNYHTIADSVEYLSFEYLAQATGISLGCLLHSDITVNAKEYSDKVSELLISPNPASDYIMIHSANHVTNPCLKIYSIDGTVKIERNIIDPTTPINISVLSPGMYLVALYSNTYIQYSRFIVTKSF